MNAVTDTSSSIINLMALQKFPQVGKSPRESYVPFFESYCDLAASMTASNPEFGLLGAVLSIAQYEIISPGKPFVLLTNPGPLIPLDPIAANRRQREVDIKMFETQQLGMRDLKKAGLVAIDTQYITLMSQPIIRMANRTVQWIVQDFLFERFGRLTPLEMQDVNKSLDAYYFPETQSLPEHFGFHVQAHNTALANNAPFSERDKVAKLRDSLLPCGLYPLAIDAWARQYPTIALQTFQNLQDAIQISDNNRDRLATAQTHGYGVAASVVPVPTAVPPSDTSLLIAQFAAMAARMEAWESKAAVPALQPKKDSQNHYCHTHGLCAHSSKDCRTPGPTHNVRATAKNTMGGAAATRRARRN